MEKSKTKAKDFLASNGVELVEKETKKRTKKSSAKLPIGEDEIRNAIQTLNDYKAKKQNFDKRVIDNEEWWKMRHWNSIRSEKQDTEPTSAWLFNSIMNKVADYSDSFPEPDIRSRSAVVVN